MQKILLIIVILISIQLQAQVQFKKLALEEAKEIAKSEDKPIFIDFRADWCKPCLEMEKTTFTNPTVASVVNSTYIPVKADVEFFDAMDMQELYNVSVLPTILIIDKFGEVQNRIIGFKTAEALLNELGHSLPDDEEIEEGYTVEEKPIKKEAKKECFFSRWWKKITNR